MHAGQTGRLVELRAEWVVFLLGTILVGSLCDIGAPAVVGEAIVFVAGEAVALAIAGLAEIVGALADATVVQVKPGVAALAIVGVIIEVAALNLDRLAGPRGEEVLEGAFGAFASVLG